MSITVCCTGGTVRPIVGNVPMSGGKEIQDGNGTITRFFIHFHCMQMAGIICIWRKNNRR
jgi:hypothetical protein